MAHPIHQNYRTVAFLDILGFKQKIYETPIEELAKKYENLIDIARSIKQASIVRSEPA